jgi:ankyrin repeat protein
MGADCQKKNCEGSTLMHFAAKNYENDGIVKFLIDCGVDTQVINTKGSKAIEQAARFSNEAAFTMLLQNESDEELNRKYGEQQETLLHISAQACNSHFLEQLLNRNVDFNAIDSNGNLFTHKIVEQERFFFLSVLEKMHSMKIPIDIQSKNNNGNSLLHLLASVSTNEQVLNFLFTNFEIDFEVINNNQKTFTHILLSHLLGNHGINQLGKLLKTFPKLVEVMNEQMDRIDADGFTPLNCLIPSWFSFESSIEYNDISCFILEYIRVEHFKRQFNCFVKHPGMIDAIVKKFPDFFKSFDELENFLVPLISSENSMRSIKIILQNVSTEKLLAKWKGTENILHLFCQTNDTSKIDFLLKHLNSNQLSNLSHQPNGCGNVAKDLLDERNKVIFVNCF